MSEPGIASERDVLLATKLHVPRPPAGFVPRPRLTARLDEADNDPARFWRHVAAALERARPGISGRVGPLLGSAPRSFEGVVTALVNELADRPAPGQALLVLDDYHLIGAGQVHAAVQFLIGHLPPGLRLVLAARSDPPLRLSRLRARGELAELRAGDLQPVEPGGPLLAQDTLDPDLVSCR